MKRMDVGRHTVLVVDDEGVIITQLEEMLTALGYDVVGKASSGRDAVRLANVLQPDIVLMDVVMPGDIDGIQACSIIQTTMDIPVVLLTAYGDDAHVNRAKGVHPYGYILKPSSNDQIKAMVEIVLEKKKVERGFNSMMNGLKHTVEDRRLQLKEVNHRIKNNLNMINALLSLQAMHSLSPECAQALQAVRGRVVAIAKIHEALHDSDNDEQINCRDYFEAIDEAVESTFPPEIDVTITLDVEEFFLEPDKVMPIGLILNELLSNALRFAFPEGRERETVSEIRVEFHKREPEYILKVSDNGVGLSESISLESPGSLGLELVRSLVTQVGGSIEVERDNGTQYVVSFPV